ncbi:MAG: cellulose binding domain-containing protein [Defluviitaleaceae bacterium]|nr:cellulose binding domain-containing protein [Defluviitaleaceae bacterium]
MLTVQFVFANERHIFNGNGFSVELFFVSIWNTGYNAEMIISNTGTENIANWEIETDVSLRIGNSGISGGKLVETGNAGTRISHVGWNSIIPAGESVSVWLSGRHELSETTPTPTKYILNGDGFSSGDLGGGDDDDPGDDNPGDNVPEPGDMPYFSLLTPIPDGRITIGTMSIEYIAVPSRGAHITGVSYTVNDTLFIKLYPRDLFPFGTGPLNFASGESHIVFTVKDSAGLETTYTVESVPYKDASVMHLVAPPHDPELVEIGLNGTPYSTSRLVFHLAGAAGLMGEDAVPLVAEAVEVAGGTVVGFCLLGSGHFTVEFTPTTLKELEAIGQRLVSENSELFFSFVFFNRGRVETGIPDDWGEPVIPDSWWGKAMLLTISFTIWICQIIRIYAGLIFAITGLPA